MFAAVLFAVSMVALVYTTWKRLRIQPPGPWGLPVVGHLLQMDLTAPHEPLVRWARHYGGIYQVRMGALPVVVVSDPELLRDALGRPELTARPDTAAARLRRPALSTAAGELWSETRRLLTARLQPHETDAECPLEDHIQTMAVSLCSDFLENNVGRQVQFGHELSAAAVNVLWSLLTGERLAADDTTVLEAVTELGHTVNKWHVAALADAFPFAEQLALLLLPPDLARQVDELAEKLLAPPLTRHRAALLRQLMDRQDGTEDDTPAKDFIEAYLYEQARRPALLSDTHLAHTAIDVLLTGAEPAAATLEWAVCFLCSRLDVQRRLQQELDLVVGRRRLPRAADLAHMPFASAVVLETLRRGDVLPLGLPHAVSRDVMIGGYRLSRGAQLTPLLAGVHSNRRLFPEPEAFRPERFLDATGRLLPADNMMPFLVGPRQCPADTLARAHVFILLATMMQRFSFSFPEGFVHDFSSRHDQPYVRRPTAYKFVPELRDDS